MKAIEKIKASNIGSKNLKMRLMLVKVINTKRKPKRLKSEINNKLNLTPQKRKVWRRLSISWVT